MVVASVLLLIVLISWVILPQYSSAVRALTTLEHISFPLVLLAGILELTSLAAYSAAGVAVAALIATSACIWFLIRRTDAAIAAARGVLRHVPLVPENAEDAAESFLHMMASQIRRLGTSHRRMSVDFVLAVAN